MASNDLISRLRDDNTIGCNDDGSIRNIQLCEEAADEIERLQVLADGMAVAHFRDALNTLADLSSYVGAGIGDNNTTADEFADRIRWGIDHIVNATIQRCADVVEQQSMNPARASFGSIKRAILDLSTASAEQTRLNKEQAA